MKRIKESGASFRKRRQGRKYILKILEHYSNISPASQLLVLLVLLPQVLAKKQSSKAKKLLPMLLKRKDLLHILAKK